MCHLGYHAFSRRRPHCHHRIAKRHVSPNERWLHPSSAKNDLKPTIQASLFVISTYCLATTQLLGLLLALEATADMGNVDYDALDTALKSSLYSWLTLACCVPYGKQIASSSTSCRRRRSSAVHPCKRPPNRRSLRHGRIQDDSLLPRSAASCMRPSISRASSSQD